MPKKNENLSDLEKTIEDMKAKDKETVDLVMGAVQNALFEKEENIETLMETVTKLEQELMEAKAKIVQLKKVLSDTLDKM